MLLMGGRLDRVLKHAHILYVIWGEEIVLRNFELTTV